jgi:hypothetical protein
MIQMSVQVQDGDEYEIVDKKARDTLAHLLGNVATTYAVSSEFTFVESSNDLLMVVAGKAYTTTLTAYEGYVLDPATVKITMAGVDVTSRYYKGGVISIPAVTGDLVIVAGAVPASDAPDQPGGGEEPDEPETPAIVRTVKMNKYNVTFTPELTQVYDGDDLDTVVKPIDGYQMATVIVAMGGITITNNPGVYDASTGRIYISRVTGTVVITASANKIETEEPVTYYTVTGSLSGCYLDPSLEEVNRVPAGEGYATVLRAYDGYAFADGSIRISAEGQNDESTTGTALRDKVYEDGLLRQATVQFSVVPGNVTIRATAADGGMWLEIRDNGPGFTREQLALLNGGDGPAGGTGLPGGSWAASTQSLRRLASLEGNFWVFPGHGGSTTLRDEKKYNPYMR